jgi:hypothetical protein
MRSFLVGFYSFATFCFVLALTVDSLGGVAAFSLALLAALGVQVLVFAMAWRWLGLRPADCSAAAGERSLTKVDHAQHQQQHQRHRGGDEQRAEAAEAVGEEDEQAVQLPGRDPAQPGAPRSRSLR